ncbi:MAG: sigma-54 factor interaction domain-containing protein, partial [Butyricicoccus pullicaecorum]|nr:sigma-54 factor interaction domain-containing protein [Butyricicoccus pullicaecorum]
MRSLYGLDKLIAHSQLFRKVIELAHRVAPYDGATVLILGESSTGKERIAETIAENSPRKGKPFIRINCGAIPENLLESELFGYEKGAFTGADSKGKKGLFEAANTGTIFLDEIGEMP